MNYTELTNSLINWFEHNKENHFFRQNRNSYITWISEIALQQTRMSAALPKLRHFLKVFPDVESLASSTEEKVLQAFKGLGYYNRARNIYKASLILKEKYNCNLPENKKELLSLPSIGEYTASIILSICFHKQEFAIDGNVKRVFSRLFEINISINKTEFNKKINVYINNFKDIKNLDTGTYNEAIMEFGQKICTVKKPLCSTCVIQNMCNAYLNNTINKYPVIVKNNKKINVIFHSFIIKNFKDEYLLIHWNNDKFLKNHIGFYTLIEMNIASANFLSNQLYLSNKKILKNQEDFISCNKNINFLNLLLKTNEPSAKPINYQWVNTKPIHHTITKYKIKILIYEVLLTKKIINYFQKHFEVIIVKKENLDKTLISTAMRKIVNL